MRGSQGLNWFSCAMILLTGGKKYDHTVTVGPASGPRAVSSASRRTEPGRVLVLAGHRTPPYTRPRELLISLLSV